LYQQAAPMVVTGSRMSEVAQAKHHNPNIVSDGNRPGKTWVLQA